MTAPLLVAGIGNIFLGDDGFGPEVVRRMGSGPGGSVRIVDYGIRGMHLAYDLLDDWAALVLVDAVPNRGEPGRIEVLRAEPDREQPGDLDAHGMDPVAVFAGVRALGGVVPPTVVVGCQVHSTEEGIGLSDPVAAAVTPAIETVRRVVTELRAQRVEV